MDLEELSQASLLPSVSNKLACADIARREREADFCVGWTPLLRDSVLDD